MSTKDKCTSTFIYFGVIRFPKNKIVQLKRIFSLRNPAQHLIRCDLVLFICCCNPSDLASSSGLLGFWTLSIVRYSKNVEEEHNVSETGSVSVFR
jgi:hypothetical protein